MLVEDGYTELVGARMFEFVNRHAPWHTALWSIGTVLSLRETIEYSDQVRGGSHNNDKGLAYVAESARKQVLRDPGVGPEELRASVLTCLADATVKTAAGVDTLRHLADRVQDGYMARLAAAARSQDPPGVEAISAAATAHMLDIGFSPRFVHSWLRRLAKQDEVVHIADVLDDAAALCLAPPQEFEVVVPFSSMPQGYPGEMPPGWLDSQQTAALLASFQPALTGDLRQAGSLHVTVTARDPASAVEKVAEIVAQAAARVAVGPRHGHLRPKASGWVRGESGDFPLRTRTRVELKSLKTSEQVFRLSGPDTAGAVYDALEIFAGLDSGTRGAELTSGWAAIEGLLLRSGEAPHTLAADRLAAIVACAFPRAELTALSYRHSPPAADSLQEALEGVEVNLDRCRIVEQAIRAGNSPCVTSASDRAMLRRVEGMIADPVDKLRNVERYVAETLRRLYTQRNLIMHAGSFRSVTLRATLRTAPKLVACGVDRVVDSYMGSPPIDPVGLAARAAAELGLLGTPAARLLCELLE